MSESTFNIIVLVFEIVLSVIIGILCYMLGNRNLKKDASDIYSGLKKKNQKKVKADPIKLSAYDAMEEQMVLQGIKYRMGASFSPFDYTVFRIAVSLGIGLLFMLYNPIFVIPGVVLGYFGVPLFFKLKDKDDNNEMLSDIGDIYGTLGLQVKNNVHISKVIYECYFIVKQPRLKKALLELSLDIDKFTTVEEAAVSFRNKFNNEHINIFAKSLEQAADTGSSMRLFEDTVENLNSINRALAIREEGKLERKGFILQTIIFFAIIAFTIYIYWVYGFGDAGNVLSF